METLSTFSWSFLIIPPNSEGTLYPTVSGILIVVAPALIATSTALYRKSKSVLVASSHENSTFFVYFTEWETDSSIIDKTSSLVFFNLYFK